jgi:hypothetical protein
MGTSLLDYHQRRLINKEGATPAALGKIMAEAGVRPEFAVTNAGGQAVVGVETHRFSNGGVTIIGLLSNPQLRVDELGPPEFKSNERFEKPQPVRLSLAAEMFVYDLRAGKPLGKMKQAQVTVSPYEPVLLACSPAALPALRIAAPDSAARGATERIGISFQGTTAAAHNVLHVDVVDPSGNVVPHYSGNTLTGGGAVAKVLPLAMNDVSGTWEIRVHNLLSGERTSAKMFVH